MIATQHLHRWQKRLAQLVEQANAKTVMAQTKCKEEFEKRFRSSKEILEPGRFEFVRKEFFGPNDRKQKVASIIRRSIPGSIGD